MRKFYLDLTYTFRMHMYLQALISRKNRYIKK